jgi:two-component system cell cycle response regulator DivK
MHTLAATRGLECTRALAKSARRAVRARHTACRLIDRMITDAIPLQWTDLPPSAQLARPPRVLLVDDEDEFLELTRIILEGAGFVVECARAAGEAVARAVARPPDVILLDILLPGCDGLEILETLRSEPETANVPVLACTALGQRDSGRLLVQAGFDGLVTKPIDWHDLERMLTAVITPGETNA